MFMTDYFPFALTEAGLQDWLDELARLKVSKAGTYLQRFLEHLQQQPPATPTYGKLLRQIQPYVLDYAKQLESLQLPAHAPKSRTLKRKSTELSYQLLRSNALLYAQLLNISDLAPALALEFSITALQLIAYCLRKQAQLSLCPSSALWQVLAEIYQRADLEQRWEHAEDCQAALKTLKLLLRQNLLFALCNPFYFAAERVDSVFAFAVQHAGCLVIGAGASNAEFTWLPSLHTAPRTFIPSAALSQLTVQLDCTQIVAALAAAPSPLLQPAEQGYLSQRLSGYTAIIESSHPGKTQIAQLFPHYHDILATLNQYTSLHNIYRVAAINAPIPAKSHLHSLQLEPVDIHTPRLKERNSRPSSRALSVAVHATSFEHYLLAIAPLTAIEAGQLCLLVTDAHTTLGVIRKIYAHPQSNLQQLLIARFNASPQNVHISINKRSQQAILLSSAESLELLIPSAKYKAGEVFKIHTLNKQGDYMFERLLEYSENFMHFKISLVSNSL